MSISDSGAAPAALQGGASAGGAAVSRETLRPLVADILKKHEADEITARDVRRHLEAALSLETDALKPQKALISELIDAAIDEPSQPAGADAKPTKKQKTDAAATGEPAPAPKAHSCVTANGEEPPKDLKKVQGSLYKSTAAFVKAAPTISVDICGSKLTGEPREFASGGRGWYLGGKIPIKVGKTTIWCQAGLNVTIPGSQAWGS